jgi:hypothetical protein
MTTSTGGFYITAPLNYLRRRAWFLGFFQRIVRVVGFRLKIRSKRDNDSTMDTSNTRICGCGSVVHASEMCCRTLQLRT